MKHATKHAERVTVSPLFPSGGWECYATIDGDYVRRRYFGYSKKESLAEYLAEFSEELEREAHWEAVWAEEDEIMEKFTGFVGTR